MRKLFEVAELGGTLYINKRSECDNSSKTYSECSGNNIPTLMGTAHHGATNDSNFNSEFFTVKPAVLRLMRGFSVSREISV
jgi:hypothetical protein